MGQRLAKHSAAREFPYSFTLINEPSINAFALPGGPIFIHSGLITAAETEGQLVGVLAHEIAHVALRHGTSQATKASLLQLPAVLAGAALGDQGAAAQAAQLGIGFGLNAVILKYSRGAEKQADALGARIMSDSGYNPLGMADFFERLQAEGGARAPAFLSSHPNPGNRSQLVQEEIQALPAHDYGAGTGQFQAMKNRVARLPEPEKPAAPSADPPSIGGFTTYRAPSWSIDYSGDWKVYEDGRGSGVTIVPANGLVRTASGGVAVGYGVVAGYYRPQSGGNLAVKTEDLIRELQSADTAIQVRRSGRAITVDAQPALITELAGESPYGGAEHNTLVTLERPEGLFYAVLVSPEAHFETMRPVYARMVRSLRF